MLESGTPQPQQSASEPLQNVHLLCGHVHWLESGTIDSRRGRRDWKH
jgi:hypothetical protein